MSGLLGVDPDYLLYSKVSLHWTPIRNGAATLPVFACRQGGLGGDDDSLEPPAGRGSGTTPSKLKIDVKFPYRML